MEHIFSGYGIEIHREDGKYFLTYDAGGIVIQYKTIEITEEEAMRAQESDEAAYWVIIHYQNMELFGEEEMNRRYAARGGRPMYDPIPRGTQGDGSFVLNQFSDNPHCQSGQPR